MRYVYIVTDCEFDGPIPGKHSLLSFGSVAVAQDGEILGEFEAVLERLEGAKSDSASMAFWHAHPRAWEAATENPDPPDAVIGRFTAWIRSFEREAVFAAHPLAVDGPWFDYYLQRFGGRPLFEGPWISGRLFSYAPLCIMSMVAGKTGRDFWSCDVEHYPKQWLGAVEHTHRAIDDARGYANLLRFLLHQMH